MIRSLHSHGHRATRIQRYTFPYVYTLRSEVSRRHDGCPYSVHLSTHKKRSAIWYGLCTFSKQTSSVQQSRHELPPPFHTRYLSTHMYVHTTSACLLLQVLTRPSTNEPVKKTASIMSSPGILPVHSRMQKAVAISALSTYLLPGRRSKPPPCPPIHRDETVLHRRSRNRDQGM